MNSLSNKPRAGDGGNHSSAHHFSTCTRQAAGSTGRDSTFGITVLILSACLIFAGPVSAASFIISSADTTARTLGTASGETGTINAASSLTVSGATVAVTISGNNATLTNNGTINQTGTGRAIRDDTGVANLTVTNNLGALMQTADADVIQMNKPAGSVTLNNYGTMTSLNASKGGAQAVDFAAILTGSNTINNYSTGIMQATDADAVRPGVNGIVYNAGTMKAKTTTLLKDGINTTTNSGVQITNDGTGLVEGTRHGISGAALNATVPFAMSITNNAGGIIRGNDGSGINIGGFNALQTVTIINNGTITGNGVTGDGDGIDVDGLINLTNTGTIRSLNSFSATTSAQSEGVTAGGGTIVNSGIIEGAVAAGNSNATGRGINISGLNTTGTADPMYGNTTITNKNGGLIKGRTSGIVIAGGASGFLVTITNEAGGTIEGGGSSAAALRTGADNDTINNYGLIQALSSGKAIDMGGGNNTLNILGGAASVIGDITGGTGGVNSMTIDPGSGNAFSYAWSISNFNSVTIKSGRVSLKAGNIYDGTTTIMAGTLNATNLAGSATGTGTVVVDPTGTLSGNGRIIAAANNFIRVNGSLIVGDTTLAMPVASQMELGTSGSGSMVLGEFSLLFFDLFTNSGDNTALAAAADRIKLFGTLDPTLGGLLVLGNPNAMSAFTVGDKWRLFDLSGGGVISSALAVDSTALNLGSELSASFDITTGVLSLSAIPEPGRAALMMLGFTGMMIRRKRGA